MLITCPNCQTTYNIPATDDPGQKVRCVKCGHVWEPVVKDADFLTDFSLTEPPKSQEQEPDISIPSFQDFFQEPEKNGNRFLKWLKPLYFISLFCIVASIYLFFFRTPARAPVMLQTISYEIIQKDYKPYLILQAAAFNTTGKDIRPKTFSVRFVDEKDRTLTTTSLESPVEVLPAHGIEEIDFQIERPPSKTAKVILTLTKTD
ncbi:MAG: zinc-ribbon domain-containing protein [Alphaproteobacteria bacterium]|nr:zinc-ribbon domain-containing protein [Alphaproteobacteria bacterium]